MIVELRNYTPFEGSKELATIDVIEGSWPFKKTVQRVICCRGGNQWYFADSGECISFWRIQNMVNAHDALQEYNDSKGE
jgi:hypothetical protein